MKSHTCTIECLSKTTAGTTTTTNSFFKHVHSRSKKTAVLPTLFFKIGKFSWRWVFKHRVQVQKKREKFAFVCLLPHKTRRIVKFHFVVSSDGNFRCLRRRCVNRASI